MARTLHAWILLLSFSFAGLPSLGWLSLRQGRSVPDCCAAGSCCAHGHCSMGAPASKMPATCPMAGHAKTNHSGISCTCSVSQLPPFSMALNHIALAFDSTDYNDGSLHFAPSPFRHFVRAAALEGHPLPADHPPKHSS